MTSSDTLKVVARGDHEIRITRSFDAPRTLVFEALSDERLLPRWLTGPPGWSMTTCEDPATAGGSFRYVWRDAAGTEMEMTGNYLAVEPPERVVRTERFTFGCEAQAGEQHATLTLTEDGERTQLEIVVRYPSREARDGALASGMEQGMAASYAQLDEVLARAV